ncbi:hypothetical protein LCGC14_1504870 [marine sediment metagenome]|uniref:Helix-turn-helix domain-containing protein n=1 Tax=marine sediment metagenome TaxID=412755 RepID=A0A0F9M4C9_9ZZZZ
MLSQGQVNFIIEHHRDMLAREMAAALGLRNSEVIYQRQSLCRQGRIRLGERKYMPPWSTEDLGYLREHYGKTPDRILARRLNRSRNAIVIAAKRKLNGLRRKDNFYTAAEVARIIGTPCSKKVADWVRRGWLKGTKSWMGPDTYKMWCFSETGIARCLRRRPWLVDVRRMEESFFRSVVIKQWERDPWYTAAQTAPLLGVTTLDAVHRYIHFGWLPAERKPGGPRQGRWVIRKSAIEAFLQNDPRPGHRASAIRASWRRAILAKGRPMMVVVIWALLCPRCGDQVKVIASPRLFGPEVKARFIAQHVNGGPCLHGLECCLEEQGQAVLHM